MLGPKKRPRTTFWVRGRKLALPLLHGRRTRANDHEKPEQYQEAGEHQASDTLRRPYRRRGVVSGPSAGSGGLRGHEQRKHERRVRSRQATSERWCGPEHAAMQHRSHAGGPCNAVLVRRHGPHRRARRPRVSSRECKVCIALRRHLMQHARPPVCSGRRYWERMGNCPTLQGLSEALRGRLARVQRLRGLAVLRCSSWVDILFG
jgi:hypothetical protein